MGGVGLKDVAVAGFQFFQDGAFVYYAGSTVVGKCAEDNEVFAIAEIHGATQFAQSCGGGGTSSDLPWGRNPDEDDRRFAYRCMMQAQRMMKPSQPKLGISGRR